jgi:diadenosine tetraphosphate (Ap4A) HIT family hydrolase
MNKSDLITMLIEREKLSEDQATRIVNMIMERFTVAIKSNEDDPFMCAPDKEFNEACIFCAASEEHYLMENDYAFAIPDKYPITDGHTLIIPKRHFADYFDSIKVEHDAIYDLLKSRGKQMVEDDPQIEGFDIGVNVGEIAGQKVFHCHIHLIPRRKGDSPRWGERSKFK